MVEDKNEEKEIQLRSKAVDEIIRAIKKTIDILKKESEAWTLKEETPIPTEDEEGIEEMYNNFLDTISGIYLENWPTITSQDPRYSYQDVINELNGMINYLTTEKRIDILKGSLSSVKKVELETIIKDLKYDIYKSNEKRAKLRGEFKEYKDDGYKEYSSMKKRIEEAGILINKLDKKWIDEKDHNERLNKDILELKNTINSAGFEPDMINPNKCIFMFTGHDGERYTFNLTQQAIWNIGKLKHYIIGYDDYLRAEFEEGFIFTEYDEHNPPIYKNHIELYIRQVKEAIKNGDLIPIEPKIINKDNLIFSNLRERVKKTLPSVNNRTIECLCTVIIENKDEAIQTSIIINACKLDRPKVHYYLNKLHENKIVDKEIIKDNNVPITLWRLIV